MDWINTVKEKWFPKAKPLNAHDAYTMTRYGVLLDEQSLYSRCIEEIASLIQAKSNRNAYSLVFDLDENIPELGIYLSGYYSNLGFNCFVLDASIDERIETPQLYLSWKRKG